ncbi:IPT/TIG domain-containing protein [Deinococcus pimensis]|uniref:IPT/TIG domain-containing protein n=1 Tax=Deinococcus pimensis TaxID=309888 RepID=UPI0004898103|nr:IPT/TIG domain-containing protein [Deinococcus pimensis]
MKIHKTLILGCALVLTSGLLASCNQPAPAPTPIVDPVPQTLPATISGLNVTTAPHGGTVTLTGTHLGTTGAVTIGGAAASVTEWSDTSVTFTVPTGAAWGYVNVDVTTGGRTVTAPAKILIARAAPDSARTTTELQTALDALPVGGVLLLGAREYTPGERPLRLDHRSVIGQGQDRTRVDGDVQFIVSGDTRLLVSNLTFAGDTFYAADSIYDGDLSEPTASALRENATTFQRAASALPAPHHPTLNAARSAVPSAALAAPHQPVQPQAHPFLLPAPQTNTGGRMSARSVTATSTSSLDFDHVTFAEVTANAGQMLVALVGSDVSFTGSTVKLNRGAQIIATNLGLDGTALTSVTHGDLAFYGAGVQVQAVGSARITRSTIRTDDNVNIMAVLSALTIEDSTITTDAATLADHGQYTNLQLGSQYGDTTVKGSTILATDSNGDTGGRYLPYVNLWSGSGDVTVSGNKLLHSDDHLEIFGGQSEYEGQAPTNHVTVDGNLELSVGDGPEGREDPTYLGIYNNALGRVTVSGNAKIDADRYAEVYSTLGQVVVKDNPDISVVSRTADTSSASLYQYGTLQLYTNNGDRRVASDVTVTGNGIRADRQVYVDAWDGNLDLSGNTVEVTGKDNAYFTAYCEFARTCTVTNNTVTLKDPRALRADRWWTGFQLYANSYDTTIGKQDVRVTGNTIRTLGSVDSNVLMRLGWGTATVSGNNVTSSGSAQFDVSQANAAIDGNTLNLFDGVTLVGGESGLTLGAYDGTEADPTLLSFTNNTVRNAGLTNLDDADGDGALDRILVDGNTGVNLPNP